MYVLHCKAEECNCRKKDQYPLEGQSLSNKIVYQATVTSTRTETYIGLASNFKEPYRKQSETEQD